MVIHHKACTPAKRNYRQRDCKCEWGLHSMAKSHR